MKLSLSTKDLYLVYAILLLLFFFGGGAASDNTQSDQSHRNGAGTKWPCMSKIYALTSIPHFRAGKNC